MADGQTRRLNLAVNRQPHQTLTSDGESCRRSLKTWNGVQREIEVSHHA